MGDPAAEALQDAVVAYLETKGVDVIVIGPVKIQHQPEERQHNHEVVVTFTGRLPDDGR